MMTNKENILGTEKVGKLLRQFAIPSIIAMLVSALYNMVDQFFIGRNVGELGNAATNVVFPLSTSCIAVALLCGIGGASAFNLAMGRDDKKEAEIYLGNSLSFMFIISIVIVIIVEALMNPILCFFGGSEEVLPYAIDYTRITAIGFPFLVLSTGGGHLVRADGSPRMTMVCNMSGAIINTILDYFFVNVFQYGMKGAAYATIIGQIISAGIVVFYFALKSKTVKLGISDLKLQSRAVMAVLSLGIAPCINQLAMMIVQIVMNKSLKYYGELSGFGSHIPIACVGIVSKVSMVFFAFIIGISQGLQPIVSFNYGAGRYDRVKEGYKKASICCAVLSILAFALFQLFPRQIIEQFGDGTEQYYQFAERYFRVFMFFMFANFVQPITANFFTAIGKPIKGVFLSLTRQILFLLPLILILPLFIGMDGILYAGPIADFIACIVATVIIMAEFSDQRYKNA